MFRIGNGCAFSRLANSSVGGNGLIHGDTPATIRPGVRVCATIGWGGRGRAAPFFGYAQYRDISAGKLFYPSAKCRDRGAHRKVRPHNVVLGRTES
jgi:hypothetical protein